MKIRTSLFISFSTVILLLLFSSAFTLITQNNFKSQYRTTLDTVTSQYEIINNTERLVTVYSSLIQNIQDKNLLNQYKQILTDTNVTFSHMDLHTNLGIATSIYSRVKNQSELLISNANKGIDNTKKSDFSQSSNILDQINRGKSTIREDVANLIIIELSSFEEQQKNIQLLENIIGIVDIVLFLGIIILSITIAIKFSNKLSRPLSELSNLADTISRGDSNITVGSKLIAMGNEIGSLSRSFNRMIIDVESKINTRTKELQEERSRLLASINSLSFGFVIVDSQNNIILKNKVILKLFGFNEFDIVTLDRIFYQLGNLDLKKEIESCLNGSGVCEMKEVIFGKKILRILVAPITVGPTTNKTIGYVLLLEDVTEARVMERSRDEFFAIASHELRTPLTAIRGNCEMIVDNFSDKIADPDVREMLSDINESAVRLIGIVNDFLEVSRLEQGKIEIKNETFDMHELAMKVVRDLQGAIKDKNITLEYILPTHIIPQVFADKGRIEQVLINLIGNSLKFTKDGGIKVFIEVSDQLVIVNVKDTGIGITEQNQLRLFRKFQQAGESMLARDITQGTGLGLYISQLIISSMGGTLRLVSSEFGKGSTFAFTIPIKKIIN